jgi:hypothetical protein
MGGMRSRLLPLALVALALVPATAQADGLPVEGVDASLSGVATAPVNGVRYVTPPAGRKTMIAAVDVDNGQLLRSRLLVGRFTVPVVAYDGSAAGLSADGKTLVLIQPRSSFPRRTTTFAVLERRASGSARSSRCAATSASTRCRPTGVGCTSSSTSRRETRPATSFASTT